MRIPTMILCLTLWCVGSLAYAAAPTISSFSPTSGPIGTVVTVYGSNLAAVTTADVNGTVAAVNVTSITLIIAAGTTTGKITVTTPNGTATSATDFTVTYAPIITSFTPTSGPIGQVVTLTGNYLTGTTSVKFNGTEAVLITDITATSLKATVPTGATSGKITVTTSDGSTSSTTDFIVQQAPTIAAISAQVMAADTVKTVNFSVEDLDTPVDNLRVTATSSNTTLLKTAKILSMQTGNSRVLTITPEPGKIGSTTITVIVTDEDGLTASTSFVLTVNRYKPDLYLRPSSNPAYTGINIISLDGATQTVGQSADMGGTAKYFVQVQNLGSTPDVFKISGPVAPVGWTVVYKNTVDNLIITDQVTTTGWNTPLLAVNGVIKIEVDVTPGFALVGGAVATQSVLVTSSGDPTKQDVGVMHTTIPIRLPDLSLRPSTVATYSGIGVYNLDGTNQTVALTVTKNVKASYYVHIRNNGNEPDSFTITGPPAPAGWIVEYRNYTTGAVITPAVTGAGWTTQVLNPATVMTVAVYVTPGSTAIGGTVSKQTMTVASVGDPRVQDVGVMETTLPVVHQPDLSLRPSTIASYSGVGVYNLDGTNQTVGQDVMRNVKATYYIHVQNKGNVAETFTITGTSAPSGWVVDYKNYSNGTVITSAITGAGWTTPVLNPGAVVTIAVYVTPGSSVINGTVATQTLTMSSNVNPTQQDVGMIQTTLIQTVLVPTLTSFIPNNGASGQVVLLIGANFTGTTMVKFNGTVATSFTVISDTSITVTVPSGATTGKIVVTAPKGSATSTTDFIVFLAPTLKKLTPMCGIIGQVVKLTGTNFIGVSSVKFNGIAATSKTVESATSITVTVPTDATTGKITVTTPGGTAIGAVDFTVTFLGAGGFLAKVLVGSHPEGIAVNPTTNRVYVDNLDDGTVSILNGITNSVLTTVPVGYRPFRIAVNPTTNREYTVHNNQSGMVSVLDGNTNAVLTTVPVEDSPQDVAVNPTTNRVYVCNRNAATMSVLDGITNTVLATVSVGQFPEGVAVNPNTNRVYVIYDHTVKVLDGNTNAVLTTIPVGDSTGGITVNSTTNRVYVCNYDTVSVLDCNTNTVFATVDMGINPYKIAVNTITNRVYVCDSYGKMSVIDGSTNAVLATVPVGQSPYGIAVNPITNLVYVSNFYDNTVSVIQGF